MTGKTIFHADIPLSIASAAFAGTSFTPERRGEMIVAEYAQTLAADFEALTKHAGEDATKRATMLAEFVRYREGYRRRYLAYLHSRTGLVSTMIAGPSKFPARRMEKRNGIVDRRGQELDAFRARALDAIRKTLHPEWRPIMAGDPDAIERLQAKLAAELQLHEHMKAANAAIRKHAKAGAEAQTFALVALGLSEGRARDLLKPDFANRIGFASFEIQNSNARIAGMRVRIATVTRAKAMPAEASDGARAKLEIDPGANRVRLIFPGKPDADTRARLKSCGFRWTPSIGAWQAYNNERAVAAARREAGVDAPAEGVG